jgi:hypothetical protein
MPAWVTIDKFNNYKMAINNYEPYNVVITRNKVLGVLEFKPDECIPMTEN